MSDFKAGDKVQWVHVFLYGTRRVRKGRIVSIGGMYATVKPCNGAQRLTVSLARLIPDLRAKEGSDAK